MRLATALLVLAAAIHAQPVPHTRTEPKPFTGAYAPTGNYLPLARTQGFIQTWYRGDSMPRPWTIQQIGWRIDPQVVSVGVTHVLEVVLASTTKTFATLEPTFANNLGAAPVTFFQAKQVSFPFQNLPTDPDQPALWLLGDQPFVFTGPHFLVQVDTQTLSPPQTLGYYVNAYTMTPTSIVNASSGRSCGGRLSATLYTNGVFDFELASAAASQPAWFLFSDEQTRLGGGADLPYDLTAFGMPGCRLGVDPFASIAAATNATGFARLRLQLPPLASQYFVVHTQVVHGGAANAAGIATTNVLHSVLGYANLSTYLYNWDQFGPVAQYGPAIWNQGAIVLIRP